MKRILIVEDDNVVANIYRSRYQVSGHQIEIANNGEVALQKITEFKPDIIQLDLMLPKVNGVEVIKKVRATAETKHIPIFVLTNGYLADLVRQAWQAGANKVLTKSECSPRLMLDMIEKELEAKPPPTVITMPAPTMEAMAGNTAMFFRTMAPPQPAAPATADDVAFEEDLRQTFKNDAQKEMTTLRALLQVLIKAEGRDACLAAIADLRRKIRSLANNSGVVGYRKLGAVASALEALLKELSDKPDQINASTYRTVAQGIDLIGAMMERLGGPDEVHLSNFKILAVDDETISRKAVMYALQKSGLPCLSLEDPHAALSVLSDNRFDLIFLDVDMPGMNGFDLCQKIRALPGQKDTPVVFVTSLEGFETRAKSTLSGGSDLIGKPFIFVELALKAFVQLFRPKA